MLSHVEEVGKAPLPDQAELDSLRSNVAKQQQKVDQLTSPEPSANGAEVPPPPPLPKLPAIFINHMHAPLLRLCTADTVTKSASCVGGLYQMHVPDWQQHMQVIRESMHLPVHLIAGMQQHFHHLYRTVFALSCQP